MLLPIQDYPIALKIGYSSFSDEPKCHVVGSVFHQSPFPSIPLNHSWKVSWIFHSYPIHSHWFPDVITAMRQKLTVGPLHRSFEVQLGSIRSTYCWPQRILLGKAWESLQLNGRMEHSKLPICQWKNKPIFTYGEIVIPWGYLGYLFIHTYIYIYLCIMYIYILYIYTLYMYIYTYMYAYIYIEIPFSGETLVSPLKKGHSAHPDFTRGSWR